MASNSSDHAAAIRAVTKRALVLRRRVPPPPPPPSSSLPPPPATPDFPLRQFLLLVPLCAVIAALVGGIYRGIFIGILLVPSGVLVGFFLLLGARAAVGESRSAVRGWIGVLVATLLVAAMGACQAKYSPQRGYDDADYGQSYRGMPVD